MRTLDPLVTDDVADRDDVAAHHRHVLRWRWLIPLTRRTPRPSRRGAGAMRARVAVAHLLFRLPWAAIGRGRVYRHGTQSAIDAINRPRVPPS